MAAAEVLPLQFKKVLIHPQVLHQAQVHHQIPPQAQAQIQVAHQTHQAPATPLHHLL